MKKYSVVFLLVQLAERQCFAGLRNMLRTSCARIVRGLCPYRFLPTLTPGGGGHHRLSAGFSYLWMLFAVAILGIGLALFSEIFQTSIKRQHEAELLVIGHEFREAIRRYYEASPGGKQYPPSMQDLVLDPRFPTIRRHLRRIYVDPLTGKADWGIVRVGGRMVGVHSLSDAEPLKIANFELVDASFSGRSKYSEWVFSYPESGAIPVGLPGPASNLPGGGLMPGAMPYPGANPATPGANSVPGGNSPMGNNSLFGSPFPGAAPAPGNPASSFR